MGKLSRKYVLERMPMDQEEREAQRYEQLFIIFSNQVERIFKMMILVCFALLIFSQIAMRIPMVRGWISTVDRLEGVPMNEHQKESVQKTLF